MPHPGEHHGNPLLIGGFYHFVITDRPARLNNSCGAGAGGGEHAVGEGEEGV
jgi:hypothetical protein